MARTLYLADGSNAVLLCPEDEPDLQKAALERLIRERLGSDAANLLNDLWRALDSSGLESELRSYEASCEDYHGILSDVEDELQELITRIDQRPAAVSKADIAQSLRNTVTKIHENL